MLLENNIKYSFIIATLGLRQEALNKCIKSIEAAFSQKNGFIFKIQIIIILQGSSAEIEFNVKCQGDSFCCYRISEKGLAIARNYGISKSKGQYLCFIDDDSFVDQSFFGVLEEIIAKYDPKAFCGRILSSDMSNEVFTNQFKDTKLQYLTYKTFTYFMGSAHVLKSEIFKALGPYDEEFGVGSRYFACEESDYFFRLIEARQKILYVPKLVFYHPSPKNYPLDKIYQYNYGIGALFAKHFPLIKKRPIVYLNLFVIPMIRVCFMFIFSSFHKRKIDLKRFYILKGFLFGFYSYCFDKIKAK